MHATTSKRIIFLCVALFSSMGCKKDAPKATKTAQAAQPATKGLDEAGALQISDTDRCPVCAMKIHKHKKFASAIELADGTTYYFCGTGCLLKSWLHPEVFLSQSRDELKRAITREYFGGKFIDASSAYWVAGSDVVGPMGPALVPLASEADLATFRKRHGGKSTFRLTDLTDEKFASLTGKNAAALPKSKDE
jgi:copper chaperone NosL